MIPEPAPSAATPTFALAYMRQDCPMTLRQGLAEYHAMIPGLVAEDGLSDDALDLFHHHDVAHVVFGCDTSVRHEAMVDTWTVFGTDVGVSEYLAYLKVPETRQVLEDTGYLKITWLSGLAVPAVLRVVRAARRMQKKWPWRDHAAWMDRPLSELRAEFGIVVQP